MTTKTKKTKSASPHWNAKISRNRKSTWVTKMVASRSKFKETPTQLRAYREKRGDSQSRLSTVLELSATTFGDIERGKRKLRRETAERILQELGVPKTRFKDYFKQSGTRKYVAI